MTQQPNSGRKQIKNLKVLKSRESEEVLGITSDLSSDGDNVLNQKYEDNTRRPTGVNNTVNASQQQLIISSTQKKEQSQNASKKMAKNSNQQNQQTSRSTSSLHQLVNIIELQKQSKQGPQAAQIEAESSAHSAKLYAPSSQAVMHQMIKDQGQAQKPIVIPKGGQPSQKRSTSRSSHRAKNSQERQGTASSAGSNTNNQLVHHSKRELKAQPMQKTAKAQTIPAYTSSQAKTRCERGKIIYPKDPNQYRRVNPEMDKELAWYRQEIEKRFNQSEMKDWTIAANVKQSYIKQQIELSKAEESQKYQQRSLKKQASQPQFRKAKTNDFVQQLQALAENYGQHLQEIIALEDNNNNKQQLQRLIEINNTKEQTDSYKESQSLVQLIEDEMPSYTLDLNTSQQDSCTIDFGHGGISAQKPAQKPESGESKLMMIAISEQDSGHNHQMRRRNEKSNSRAAEYQQEEDVDQSMIAEEGQPVYKSAKELKSPFHNALPTSQGRSAQYVQEKANNQVKTGFSSALKVDESYHLRTTDRKLRDKNSPHVASTCQNLRESGATHNQQTQKSCYRANSDMLPKESSTRTTSQQPHNNHATSSSGLLLLSAGGHLAQNQLQQPLHSNTSKASGPAKKQTLHNSMLHNYLEQHRVKKQRLMQQLPHASQSTSKLQHSHSLTMQQMANYNHQATTGALSNSMAHLNGAPAANANSSVVSAANRKKTSQQKLAHNRQKATTSFSKVDLKNSTSSTSSRPYQMFVDHVQSAEKAAERRPVNASNHHFTNKSMQGSMLHGCWNDYGGHGNSRLIKTGAVGSGHSRNTRSQTQFSQQQILAQHQTAPAAQKPEYNQVTAKPRKATSRQARKKQLLAMQQLRTGDDQYSTQQSQSCSVRHQGGHVATSLSTKNQLAHQRQDSSAASRSTSNKRGQPPPSKKPNPRSLSNGRSSSRPRSNSRNQRRSLNKSSASPAQADPGPMLPYSFYQDQGETVQCLSSSREGQAEDMSGRKSKVLSLSEARSMGILLQPPSVTSGGKVNTRNKMQNSLHSLAHGQQLAPLKGKQTSTKAQHSRHRTGGLAQQVSHSNQKTLEANPGAKRAADVSLEKALLSKAQRHLNQVKNGKRQRADLVRSQEAIVLEKGSSQVQLSTEQNADTLETQERHLEDDCSQGTTAVRRKSANKSIKQTRPQQHQKQTQRQVSKQSKYAQRSLLLINEAEPALGSRCEQMGEPQKVDGSPAWDWTGEDEARQASLPSNLGPATSTHIRPAHPVVQHQPRSNTSVDSKQFAINSVKNTKEQASSAAEILTQSQSTLALGAQSRKLQQARNQDRSLKKHNNKSRQGTLNISISSNSGNYNQGGIIHTNTSNTNANGNITNLSSGPQPPHMYTTAHSKAPGGSHTKHQQRISQLSSQLSSKPKRKEQKQGSRDRSLNVDNQSLIDLEAIKKSINKRIGQNTANMKSQQEALAILQSQKGINNNATSQGRTLKKNSSFIAQQQTKLLMHQQHNDQKHTLLQLPMHDIIVSKNQYGAVVSQTSGHHQQNHNHLSKSSSQLSFHKLQEHYKNAQLMTKKSNAASGKKQHQRSSGLIQSQYHPQGGTGSGSGNFLKTNRSSHVKQQSMLVSRNTNIDSEKARGQDSGMTTTKTQGSRSSKLLHASVNDASLPSSNSKTTYSLFEAYQTPLSNNHHNLSSQMLAQVVSQQQQQVIQSHQKATSYGAGSSRNNKSGRQNHGFYSLH